MICASPAECEDQVSLQCNRYESWLVLVPTWPRADGRSATPGMSPALHYRASLASYPFPSSKLLYKDWRWVWCLLCDLAGPHSPLIKLYPSNAGATFVQGTRTQKSLKTIWIPSCWYSLDSSRRVLSDEYQPVRVSVILQIWCMIFWLAKLGTTSIRGTVFCRSSFIFWVTYPIYISMVVQEKILT